MSDVPPQGRANAQRFAKAAGAAAASLGVTVPVAGVMAGVALAGPLGLTAALAGVLSWAATQFANDPPDPDFVRAAVARRPRLDDSIFPPGPAPQTLRGLTVELNEAVGWLTATLRAYERAQGAARAGRADYERARLRETQYFAQGAAERLTITADRALATADVLATFEDPVFVAPQPAGASVRVELLGDEALSFIFRAGLPLKDLGRGLDAAREARGRDTSPPVAALTAASGPARDLASFLQQWEPTTRESRER